MDHLQNLKHNHLNMYRYTYHNKTSKIIYMIYWYSLYSIIESKQWYKQSFKCRFKYWASCIILMIYISPSGSLSLICCKLEELACADNVVWFTGSSRLSVGIYFSSVFFRLSLGVEYIQQDCLFPIVCNIKPIFYFKVRQKSLRPNQMKLPILLQ